MIIRSVRLLLYSLIAFSVFTTVTALYSVLVPRGVSIPLCTGSGICASMSAFGQMDFVQAFVKQTPFLASGGWGLVAITSLWYQRTTSTWRKMGFDSDVFQLLMRARGGPTRIRLLRSLTTSKNRLELSQELGYDWNVIDRHIRILLMHGMIEETAAYGHVKLYQLTETGKKLVRLIEDLQDAETEPGPSHGDLNAGDFQGHSRTSD
jgi:DNA-binding MarR family transcriptional regulator